MHVVSMIRFGMLCLSSWSIVYEYALAVCMLVGDEMFKKASVSSVYCEYCCCLDVHVSIIFCEKQSQLSSRDQ